MERVQQPSFHSVSKREKKVSMMFESFKASHQDPTILKHQKSDIKDESRLSVNINPPSNGPSSFGNIGLGPRRSMLPQSSSELTSPDHLHVPLEPKNYEAYFEEQSRKQSLEIEEMEKRLTKNIDEKFSAILEIIKELRKE